MGVGGAALTLQSHPRIWRLQTVLGEDIPDRITECFNELEDF